MEETKRGKTSFRSRMYNDILYFFNEAPNVNGLPEGMRRKYRFAIAPKRPPAYEDSKEQTEHPMVVPLEREPEMIADQVLPRYLEKQTVLLVQGGGAGSPPALLSPPASPSHPVFFLACLLKISAVRTTLPPYWQSFG